MSDKSEVSIYIAISSNSAYASYGFILVNGATETEHTGRAVGSDNIAMYHRALDRILQSYEENDRPCKLNIYLAPYALSRCEPKAREELDNNNPHKSIENLNIVRMRIGNVSTGNINRKDPILSRYKSRAKRMARIYLNSEWKDRFRAETNQNDLIWPLRD